MPAAAVGLLVAVAEHVEDVQALLAVVGPQKFVETITSAIQHDRPALDGDAYLGSLKLVTILARRGTEHSKKQLGTTGDGTIVDSLVSVPRAPSPREPPGSWLLISAPPPHNPPRPQPLNPSAAPRTADRSARACRMPPAPHVYPYLSRPRH